MADKGVLDLQVRPYQLFRDVMELTGWTGTYQQFCRAIISSGGGTAVSVDESMSATSTNPVQNKTITVALAGKQDTLEFLNTLDIDNIFAINGMNI